MLLSFGYPLHFLKSSLAMHYVVCFFPAWPALRSLKCPWFSSNVWFDIGSSIKLLSSKILLLSSMWCDLTQCVVNFDFTSNFLKSLLATHYDSYSFFFAWVGLYKVNESLLFPNFQI